MTNEKDAETNEPERTTDVSPAAHTEETHAVLEAKAPMAESATPSNKKKYLLICVGLILLKVLVALVVMQLTKGKSDKSTNSSPASSQAATQTAEPKRPVFCAALGVRSVQCEDLNTGEHRKYELPDSFGRVVRLVPNKSGSMLFADVYLNERPNDNTTAVEVFKIYDLKLKELAKLPSDRAEAGSSNLQDVGWLDDDTAVYSKVEGDKKRIFAYDVKAQKESLLIETDKTVERLMPSGDKTYIYAIQGLVNTTTNSVERKLIVINTRTKALTDVTNAVIDVNSQDLAFNASTSLFYANILLQAEQRYNLRTFRVDDIATRPKLVVASQLDNAKFVTEYAYHVTVTEKGVLAQPESDLKARAPYKLYTATNKYKSLKLGVGSQNGFYLPLQSFPEFRRSPSNEPVTRDFFQPPAGTPQAITSFVDKLVTNKDGCRPGEYGTYELTKNDGDAQFGLLEQGCASIGLVFYKRENGTYRQITSTREGLSCEERDKFGISEKVFPDCRKPGEGL